MSSTARPTSTSEAFGVNTTAPTSEAIKAHTVPATSQYEGHVRLSNPSTQRLQTNRSRPNQVANTDGNTDSATMRHQLSVLLTRIPSTGLMRAVDMPTQQQKQHSATIPTKDQEAVQSGLPQQAETVPSMPQPSSNSKGVDVPLECALIDLGNDIPANEQKSDGGMRGGKKRKKTSRDDSESEQSKSSSSQSDHNPSLESQDDESKSESSTSNQSLRQNNIITASSATSTSGNTKKAKAVSAKSTKKTKAKGKRQESLLDQRSKATPISKSPRAGRTRASNKKVN